MAANSPTSGAAAPAAVILDKGPGGLETVVLGVKGMLPRGIIPGVGKGGPIAADAPVPDRVVGFDDLTIDLDRLKDYDDLTGLRRVGPVPITYLYVLGFPLSLNILLASDFPFSAVGTVHLENTLEQFRPVTENDTISIRAHAENLREHRKGMLIDIRYTFTDAAGEVVATQVSTMLSQQKTSLSSEESAPKPKQIRPPVASTTITVTPGQIKRYAKVSGDSNPIHVSKIGAKAFGFPSTIAHGMWSAAAILRVVEGQLPDAFVYTVKFARPVVLPAKLGLTVKRDGNTWEIAGFNPRAGYPHLNATITAK